MKRFSGSETNRTLILALRNTVETTSRELQTKPVDDADPTAQGADQASAFELVQGDGDARAAYAEQQGK
jgi:hypothetical protein